MCLKCQTRKIIIEDVLLNYKASAIYHPRAYIKARTPGQKALNTIPLHSLPPLTNSRRQAHVLQHTP